MVVEAIEEKLQDKAREIVGLAVELQEVQVNRMAQQYDSEVTTLVTIAVVITILAAFATMVTNLRDLIQQIDTGANNIASSSEELSTVTEQTSQGVPQQRDPVLYS